MLLNRFMKALYKYLPEPEDYVFHDMWRTAKLLRLRDYYLQNPNVSEVPDDVFNAIDADVQTSVTTDWEVFNRKQLTAQVRHIFHHLQDNEGRADEDINLSGNVNHSLIVKESSIPNAGNGVFLRSSKRIIPGTVLGFYPGIVHPSCLIKNKDYLGSLLPDPDMLLALRVDGSAIDARAADLVPQHRLAVGHLVNHCGKTPPNVLNISFDFPKRNVTGMRLSAHHYKFIPNINTNIPTGMREAIEAQSELDSCLMRTILLVSCTHIEDGEELLMDYRLNAKSKNLPPWYEPYDLTESKQRWRLLLQ